MILRKPYAFFIKMFKPIHLALGVLIGILMLQENKIFRFFEQNIYTSVNLVGQNLKEQFASSSLYIIPIVLMLFFIAILTTMFTKQKPVTFYVVSIFCMLAVLIVNIYTVNFIGVLEKSIVSVKSIKLIHDLVFITMLVEGVLLIFMVIRGAGVNIQKFNFDSDISKIEISEKDNEEFELNIKFDTDSSRRNRKRRLRYLKYAYIENKFIINIVLGVIVLTAGVLITFMVLNHKKVNKEGIIYSTNTCSIVVDNTYLVDKSYTGDVITNNYLVIVNARIRLNYKDAKVYGKDFNLGVSNYKFKSTDTFNKYLVDLGNIYKDKSLTEEFTNNLFVFEIPKDYSNKTLTFEYNDGSKNLVIRLNPIKLGINNKEIEASLENKLTLEDSLNNISFKINSYEIKDRFKVEYDFCLNDTKCIKSKEYVVATINENYDKTVLKLNMDYSSSNNEFKKFYNLLNTFGYIEYTLGDNVIKQKLGIEEIISNKDPKKDIIYLGINKEIEKATSIKLVFNIRGKKYTYILKGEL